MTGKDFRFLDVTTFTYKTSKKFYIEQLFQCIDNKLRYKLHVEVTHKSKEPKTLLLLLVLIISCLPANINEDINVALSSLPWVYRGYV